MIDPTQQAAPAGQPPEASGTTVCITANPDGSFKVYKEGTGEQDQAPADNVDDALSQAAQLLQAGGQAPEQGMDDANAMFSQSFDKARGNGMGG